MYIVNQFINTDLRANWFIDKNMTEVLNQFYSSLAPDQYFLNICDYANRSWSYDVYSYKEITQKENSLFWTVMLEFGVFYKEFFYFYQHDASNKYGVNAFYDEPIEVGDNHW